MELRHQVRKLGGRSIGEHHRQPQMVGRFAIHAFQPNILHLEVRVQVVCHERKAWQMLRAIKAGHPSRKLASLTLRDSKTDSSVYCRGEVGPDVMSNLIESNRLNSERNDLAISVGDGPFGNCFDRLQNRLQRCRRKTRNAVYVFEKIGRGERI